MHCSLFKFTWALYSALVFWKLLVFELLPGIPEPFPCSVSALLVKGPARYASAATDDVCRGDDIF
jgi:hypothetical protein